MLDSVSPRMIEAIALAGTAEEVREQHARRIAGRYEYTLLWPPAFTGLEGTRAVIDAFRLLAAARAQPPRSPASTHASGK